MTELVAAVLEEHRADIERDLSQRLTRKVEAFHGRLPPDAAGSLLTECRHVVADLACVLREGIQAVRQHDHDRDLAILRYLGVGNLDGQWPARLLFEVHTLLRSRIMEHVLSNLPPGLSGRENHQARMMLYEGVSELLGSSPCDFVDAVEKRLRAQRDELAWLTHKTLVAQEEERRRVAQNVHDVLSSALTAGLLRVRAALARLESGEGDVAAELEAAQEALERCSHDMRQVARDLRPHVLDAYGLAAAVRDYAARVTREYGLQVNLADGVYERARLSPDQEVALFRIAQEAMTNAARHAQATALTVRISGQGESVHLEIRDDGEGFDLDHQLARAVDDQHLGLLGMRERAELLGGELKIVSQPGKGTAVSVRVPRRAEEA
ncbi:MAG: sensor histidine kinase [Armatimonadota bacterium]